MGKLYTKITGTVEYCYVSSKVVFNLPTEKKLACDITFELLDVNKELIDTVLARVEKIFDNSPTVSDIVSFESSEVVDFINSKKEEYAGYTK